MFDIEFRDPWFLLMLVLVPWAFTLMRRPRSSLQYSSFKLFRQIPTSFRSRFALLPPVLVALSVSSLALALARPRTPDAETRVSKEGIAIMMIVDRSSSMNARDLVSDDTSVDRLQVVQKVEFL